MVILTIDDIEVTVPNGTTILEAAQKLGVRIPSLCTYQPLHPTQVYEMIFLLLLFAGLIMLWGRLKPDGSVFFVYLGAYSLWRVGIDFIREGSTFFLGLHQAQIIGLLTLIIVIPILAYRTRWVKAGETIGDTEEAEAKEDK